MSLRIGESYSDYRILEQIGTGGMGQVYRAEHIITGRYEALKAVLKESTDDPDIGARFLREIRLHANLNHTNIVAVYNAFWADQTLVLAMEYVDGEPLDRVMKMGPMPLSRAADIACQTLEALSYAHSRGVTHRDVSPTNILISSRGAVKLMDFGLAIQPKDARLTQSGVPVGSLAYMAPEQVKNGADADFRSDIYSMGVVLYQMLSGKRPFTSDNGFEIMKAHIEKAPPPLRQWVPQIPDSVERIVLKALEKRPDARFSSADSFKKALMEVVNPTTPAKAVSVAPKSFSERHIALRPGTLAAITLVVILLSFLAARSIFSNPPVEQPVVADTPDPKADPSDPNALRPGPRADQMQRSGSPPGGTRPRQPVRKQ
jgi:eukaryotic-like serine/threonine-protein kinase